MRFSVFHLLWIQSDDTKILECFVQSVPRDREWSRAHCCAFWENKRNKYSFECTNNSHLHRTHSADLFTYAWERKNRTFILRQHWWRLLCRPYPNPKHTRSQPKKTCEERKKINRRIAAALTFSAPSHLLSSASTPHRLFRRPNMNSKFSSRAHAFISHSSPFPVKMQQKLFHSYICFFFERFFAHLMPRNRRTRRAESSRAGWPMKKVWDSNKNISILSSTHFTVFSNLEKST